MSGFRQSFAIQRRVIGALIIRETYTRFGRENLGFSWIFGEFLIFALPVMAMWRFIRGHYEHGILVVPFVWSGYLPILLFRHIGGRMLSAVRLNMSLFYHRNVTPFDAIISRMAIEIIGNYGSAVFSYLLLYQPRRGRLALRYAAAVSRLSLHDLVVRLGRVRHRRIQRTHPDLREGLGRRCRISIWRLPGFRIWPPGCRDGCGR